MKDFESTKLFTLFQGNELEFIFSSVLEKYSVNETRMLNYAARRGEKKIWLCLSNKSAIRRAL